MLFLNYLIISFFLTIKQYLELFLLFTIKLIYRDILIYDKLLFYLWKLTAFINLKAQTHLQTYQIHLELLNKESTFLKIIYRMYPFISIVNMLFLGDERLYIDLFMLLNVKNSHIL